MNKAKLFVISAPSGGGKTTIVKSILGRYRDFAFSISATTRPRRSNELEGKDYFFLTKEEFERLIKEGELVEYERIYGHYYGTLKREVDRSLASGKSMVLDVDVKGAMSIKKLYGKKAVLIFIEPPNLAVLQERLRNRKTEDERTLKKRMERVALEMDRGKTFDHRVINDRLGTAIEKVNKIISENITH